jgi:hypothetical protein
MKALAFRTFLVVLPLSIVGVFALRSMSGLVADATNEPPWLVESYNNGVLTVHHIGYTYTARCLRSDTFNAPRPGSTPQEHRTPTCDTAVDLVGRSIQPMERRDRNSEGDVVQMWQAGGTLALRTWKNEHSAWQMDQFAILAMTPSR